MDLGHLLAVAWRRKFLILQAVILVATVAAGLASRQEASYSATSRVLLLTNDPTAVALGTYGRPVDAEEFLLSQFEVAQSPAVQQRAADMIGGFDDITGVAMGRGTSVDVMTFTVTSPVPDAARDAANALAEAYVENRRQSSAAGLQQAVDDLDQRLGVIREQLASIEGELARRAASGVAQPVAGQSDVIASSALEAQRETTSEQYQTVYAQQQSLLVQMNVQRGVAEMLAEAALPTESDRRSPVELGLLGAACGLALGCAAAFVLDQLDDRIRNAADVVAASDVPVLTELPQDATSSKAKGVAGIAVVDRPMSALAESVRALRTSTTFLGIDEPIRRIAVTSANAGDGKSFVALNLAAAYAQSGVRTILVSSDLRRPSIERVLGVGSDQPGFCDAILRSADQRHHGSNNGNGHLPGAAPLDPEVVSTLLVDTPVEHLWLLPAGSRPSQPAELLASNAAAKTFDAISAAADLVIYDTPPLTAVTDAAVIAAHVDATIVVVSAGRTRGGQLRAIVERLEQSRPRVITAVLNRSGTSTGEYGYYSPIPERPSRRERRKEAKAMR